MTATIKDLITFIDTATRNRKYMPNTAHGLKAAVRLFQGELNEEELASLDLVKKNIEQIYQGIFSKNSKFTAASLTTYKWRMLKVIDDYENYGTDATKMSNWAPKVIKRGKRSSEKSALKPDSGSKTTDQDDYKEVIPSNMHKIELALRADAKFVLVIPRDLRKSEVTTLNAVLTSLIVNEVGNEPSGIQEASAE